MTALIASTFGHLDYRFNRRSLPIDAFRSQMYASAAVTVFVIVSYTVFVMKGPITVNKKPIAKVENIGVFDVAEKVTDASLPKGESVRELLHSWGNHPTVKGLFPLIAVVLDIAIGVGSFGRRQWRYRIRTETSRSDTWARLRIPS